MHARLESWRDIAIACPPVPLVLPDELLDSSNFASLKTRRAIPASHSRRKADAKAALSQKLKPSPKLAEILGSSQPLSRADTVKELWD
jgi:chromatin remodeling complex protein RSC6